MEAVDLKEQAKECIKVCKSFRYFLDKYGYIEDKISSEAIPFKLWPAQVRILPDFLVALRLIILKARQLGLTWLTAAYCLWCVITKPLQLIIVISAKEDWAIEFLDRCKFIYERLPDWMTPNINSNTKTTLEFIHIDDQGNPLFSTIKSLTTTPSGAQSKTPTLLVLDETARIENIKSIYASSKPGIDVAEARIILISNSIKDGVGWSWTRDIYTKSMTELNDFKRIFMAWWDHPHRNRDHFIEQQRVGGMDEEDIRWHYPETEAEAISAILGSYFGSILAKHNDTSKGIFGRLEEIGDKRFFKLQERGILEVWKQPYSLMENWDGFEWEKRYVIGSDVSEGLGQSYSVAYVLDRLTNQIACKMRSNRIDAYEWANELSKLAKYYDNAFICPERTGPGITTCKRLHDLKANLYIKLIPAKEGRASTREIGWSENHQSKHELCGDLKTWLRMAEESIPCANLLEELSTFIQHDNGKLEAEEGKLDDCVIGIGCAIQMNHFLGQIPQKSEKSVIQEKLKKEQIDKLDDTSKDAWKQVDDLRERLEVEREYEESGEVW